MTAAVAERELVLEQPDELRPHLIHVACQYGAAFLTTVCGLAKDVNAGGFSLSDVHCTACLSPDAACPVCGEQRQS